MEEQVIVCPNCGEEIPLTEAISHQIRERLQKEFKAKLGKREKEMEERAGELASREEEIKKAKESIDKEVAEQLKDERAKLEEKSRKKAEEEFGAELESLKGEIEEKKEKIRDFQKKELELRKGQEKLEEEKQGFELEMARKLAEEKKKLSEQLRDSVEEEYRLKERELKEKIEGMKKQVEELKRKAEQGSQQAQGEVMELELEDELKKHFPFDKIEPVPKGMRGADVLQEVCNEMGQACGTIIWEAKRTKKWSSGWVEKLKEDQREAKADIAVIRTVAMPEEVKNFGCIDGVWVTDHASLGGLATALRINLIQLAGARTAAVGKNEKMDLLYDYLSGQAFKQNVEAIVEAFTAMRGDLDKEKRAMTRIWAKREKQMEKVINSTATLYGDMQGIIGASIPEIESLELKALTSGEDEDHYELVVEE